MSKTDVIIPCLNEQKTIGEIVYQFTRHPAIGKVHVMVDDATNDSTQFIAETWGGIGHRIWGVNGKGQLIASGTVFVATERVILSDGDYTQINQHVIDEVLAKTSPAKTMRIVVPRPPTAHKWAKSGIPDLPFDHNAWCMMSGLRSLPVTLLDEITEPYGYLLETQLNKAARAGGYPIEVVVNSSLIAPLRFTERRLNAMEQDRNWGLVNGVFE